MQTWSSQLGQIYTNLATPFINEWQAGEVAKEAAAEIANVQDDAHGVVGPWCAVEVDWDSFVFEVPAKTPLPLQRPRACSHDMQDKILQFIDTHDASLLSGGEEEEMHDTRSFASEFSETSVAPDNRFKYTSEADEDEFAAYSSCTSDSSEGEGNNKDAESQVVKEGENTNHQNEPHCDLDKVDDKGNSGNTGEVLPSGHVKRLCKLFAAQSHDKPG